MQFSRSSIIWTFVALVILRVVIGLHFYNEGLSKIRSGTFNAAGFLSQARGPAAGYFRGLIDDYDGHQRLSVSADNPFKIDPQPTIAIWETWLESVSQQNQFDEQQRAVAQRIFDASKTSLLEFYADNQVEIIAWLKGGRRLEGFTRDGAMSERAAQEVASLENQVGQIAVQRRQTAAAWFNSIESRWHNLELAIRDVAGHNELAALPRPWAPGNSRLQMINRFLPWFDLTVGILLIVGLATRLAALAGMCLLAGVLATQPFWVPGAENTYYQWIEFAGLFLLLAAGAGRFGGLDYYFVRRNQRAERAETEIT